MIPDYQTLMRPVLQSAAGGERKIADVVEELSDSFDLTSDERAELLPSGRQTKIANRVHWARSYLKQAGLLSSPSRGRFALTEAGRMALNDAPERITNAYLRRFPEFLSFQARSREAGDVSVEVADEGPRLADEDRTPTELMAEAYKEMRAALAIDLIDRLRNASPQFFERTVVDLLLAMGYGAASGRGSVLGQSGDNGVDGVIDKDPLGVDQVYVQAKRYGDGGSVGAGEIRDFFGALSLKDVSRGIFVTTSVFSPSARQTAEKLGARIVLIDGPKLAGLMIDHEVGCRVRQVYRLAEVDDGFFV